MSIDDLWLSCIILCQVKFNDSLIIGVYARSHLNCLVITYIVKVTTALSFAAYIVSRRWTIQLYKISIFLCHLAAFVIIFSKLQLVLRRRQAKSFVLNDFNYLFRVLPGQYSAGVNFAIGVRLVRFVRVAFVNGWVSRKNNGRGSLVVRVLHLWIITHWCFN